MEKTLILLKFEGEFRHFTTYWSGLILLNEQFRILGSVCVNSVPLRKKVAIGDRQVYAFNIFAKN